MAAVRHRNRAHRRPFMGLTERSDRRRKWASVRAGAPLPAPHPPLSLANGCPMPLQRGGLRSGSVKSNCEKFWSRTQTSQSLKEQHFCTGDTQGTNTHARGTSKMQLRNIGGNCPKLRTSAPPCDIPSCCCFFTGPRTVTQSSLRVLRRVAAFCRPLRPVLRLVPFPYSRCPVVGVPGRVKRSHTKRLSLNHNPGGRIRCDASGSKQYEKMTQKGSLTAWSLGLLLLWSTWAESHGDLRHATLELGLELPPRHPIGRCRGRMRRHRRAQV